MIEHWKNLDLADIVYTNEFGMKCTEIWKDIPGYDGFYQISDFGRVKSLYRKVPHPTIGSQTIREKIKAPTKNVKGYIKIALCKEGKYGYFSSHRLVGLAFIPNPNNLPWINHKNLITFDNRVQNLEWCTESENTKHAWDNGACSRKIEGKCNFTKLKKEDVLKIRELAKTQSRKSIREMYNMSETGIEQIINRKTWKHI